MAVMQQHIAIARTAKNGLFLKLLPRPSYGVNFNFKEYQWLAPDLHYVSSV